MTETLSMELLMAGAVLAGRAYVAHRFNPYHSYKEHSVFQAVEIWREWRQGESTLTERQVEAIMRVAHEWMTELAEEARNKREARRSYDALPWWKRLFRKRPSL